MSPGDRSGSRRAAAHCRVGAASALLFAFLLLSCGAPHAIRKEPEISPPPAAAPTGALPKGAGPLPEGVKPLPPPVPSRAAAPVLDVPPAPHPVPPAVEEAVDPEATLPAEPPVRLPPERGERVDRPAAPPPEPSPASPPSQPPPREGRDHRAAATPKPPASHPGEGGREERKRGKGVAPPTAAAVPPLPWETEDLSFQVRYLGVPCGYARFRAMGRVRLGDREAVHLQVRGWTSKLLSIVYPLDTTMDYYIDPATMLPLRIDQRKTERGRYKASVAVYDQAKGEITYWKPDTGRMEKRVRTVPAVHDPVTVVYNIRTLDPAAPGAPRYVYAGRKVWQVQPRRVGQEVLADEAGRPVEAVVLAPLIRREGQEESKGDIRVWISRDGRRVPLRIYAAIKLGTVEGRLIPTPTPTGGK